MDQLERKTSTGYLVKAEASGGVGTVSAIVSVFNNVDHSKERVIPGYFKDSIAAKLPKAVWSHDWTRPICKTIDARELMPGDPELPDDIKDLGGLMCTGEFYEEITDSWQAYLMISKGMIDEYSFGYKNLVVTDRDPYTGVRDLVKGVIREWSPVLVGDNPLTSTLSVKSILRDLPVGANLDDHTALLAERWEKQLEARKADATLTPDFVNRLREAGQKLLDLAAATSEDRHSEDEQEALKNALAWEQSKHRANIRAIRGQSIG